MRKFLIVALGLAGVGVFAVAALADKFTLHLTKAQLENGCTAGNGHFDSDNDGYSCVTTKSTIKCTKDGSCVLTDHMILTRPTNNTHGPVAQGGNKVIGNPGNTTGAAGGPATTGNTTSAGAGNTTNAGAGNATGASTASSTTKSGAPQNLGAAFMSNGRPRTQER
jgi:hypothetical protein